MVSMLTARGSAEKMVGRTWLIWRRRIGVTIANSLLLMSGSACSAGPELEVEERVVADFHAISVAISGDIRLERGENASLTIQAWPETLEQLRTEVDGGTLEIYREDPGWLQDAGPIEITIIYQTLDALLLSGSADVQTDRLTGTDFRVEINGSSDVRVPDMAVNTLQVSVGGSGDLAVGALLAETVQIDVNGSGDVTLQGSAEMQTVMVRGSGDVDNAELQSLRTEVKVTGSGDAVVRATEGLAATVSGSGDIRVLGDPAEVSTDVTGSGRISRD